MQWFFDYPWGPVLTWLVVLAMFAVLGVSFWTVRQEIKTWSGRITVIGLRVLAAALMVFMLLQPQTRTTKQTVLQSFTGVLLDTSKSMGIIDAGRAKSRLEIGKELLFDSKSGLLAKLKEKGNLRFFVFSKEIEEVPLDRLETVKDATGDATAIGSALASAQAQFGGEDLTSLVVLTDGIDNAGQNPKDVAGSMKPPLPVFLVGIGAVAEKQAGEEKDYAIDNVQAQKRVMVQKATDVIVSVSSRGYSNRAVQVAILHEKQTIATGSVALGQNRRTGDVVLRYTPQVPGKYVYVVEVPPEKDEQNKENNRRTISVQVIDPVSRVLYLEGTPRWESKFVNRILNANRNVQSLSYIQTGPGTYLVQGNVSGASAQPPLGEGELDEFKVLAIGDLGRDVFSDDQLQRFAKFVENGGSLLLLGTKRNFQTHGFAGTPLGQVLPVVVGEDHYLEMKASVATTPEGAAHPVFQAITIDNWGMLPQLDTVISTGKLKAGATALLTTADGQYPIVVAHQYGQGKVVVVLSDSLWRWKLGRVEAPLPVDVYTLFWTGLVDWLLPSNAEAKRAKAVELLTDKDEYEPNQTVHLVVSVTDADTGPAKDAAVKCLVKSPDGKILELHAPYGDISTYSSTMQNGYSTSFMPHMSGTFAVTGVAERGGQEIGREEISFTVGDPSLEFRVTDINKDLLQDIAGMTGGKLYTPDTAGKLVNDVVAKSKKVPTIQKNEVWNEWWVLVAFVALISSEWVVRKRRQLA